MKFLSWFILLIRILFLFLRPIYINTKVKALETGDREPATVPIIISRAPTTTLLFSLHCLGQYTYLHICLYQAYPPRPGSVGVISYTPL